MKTVKLAIVGLGRIGKIHLRNLCRNYPEVVVMGAMDALDASRRIAEESGVRHFVQTMDELIGLPDLDGIVICSPTNTHADYVEKAAKSGKQIFCEKPLDLSLDRAQEVLAIVEEMGVGLMLGFNRRFDPEFKRIRVLVVNGSIGDRKDYQP